MIVVEKNLKKVEPSVQFSNLENRMFISFLVDLSVVLLCGGFCGSIVWLFLFLFV